MSKALAAPFGRSKNGRAVAWPRRAAAGRVKRKVELWERVGEGYPAATVLEDLDKVVGDAEAAQRILARFAAIRLVLLILSGQLTLDGLATERGVARSYTDVLPDEDPERRALFHIISLAKPRLRRTVIGCANEAGELATRQGHAAGAFWLHHIAYAVSLACGWRREARRAARAIEAAAEGAGAKRSARIWRARAVALERVR